MFRSEIWLVNLDPTIGAEMKKMRPAVIVNDDDVGTLPLRVAVPLTDWKDRYEVANWLVKIEPDAKNGLSKTSAADAFQVRSLAEIRFAKKIGEISRETMTQIEKALAAVFRITVV